MRIEKFEQGGNFGGRVIFNVPVTDPFSFVPTDKLQMTFEGFPAGVADAAIVDGNIEVLDGSTEPAASIAIYYDGTHASLVSAEGGVPVPEFSFTQALV